MRKFLSKIVFLNINLNCKIKFGSLIEMSIGAAVGAITFSGSVIALKLQGIMYSPITFRKYLIILVSIIVLTTIIINTTSNKFDITHFLILIPGLGGVMPVVISMLNSYC